MAQGPLAVTLESVLCLLCPQCPLRRLGLWGSPPEGSSLVWPARHTYNTVQPQYCKLFKSDDCALKHFPEGSTLLSVSRGQHVCEDEVSPG